MMKRTDSREGTGTFHHGKLPAAVARYAAVFLQYLLAALLCNY